MAHSLLLVSELETQLHLPVRGTMRKKEKGPNLVKLQVHPKVWHSPSSPVVKMLRFVYSAFSMAAREISSPHFCFACFCPLLGPCFVLVVWFYLSTLLLLLFVWLCVGWFVCLGFVIIVVTLWQPQGWCTVSSKTCYINQVKKILLNFLWEFICFQLLSYD